LDGIIVGGHQLWIYGSEEEGVIVLSSEASQPLVSEMDVITGHFFICVMSLERTCLRGFSFRGRGGAFWPSSKATDFRFLGVFMGRKREVETRGLGWMGGTEKNGTDGPINPIRFVAQNGKPKEGWKLLDPPHLH
jgi:hypothetical protein